jgi:hypothetical protein
MSVNPAPSKGAVGKALGSGFRARGSAVPSESPASGVRATGGLLPTPRVAIQPRAPMESDAGLTRVGPPPASLLALARGEPSQASDASGAVVIAPAGNHAPAATARVSRVRWFCLGMLAGAAAVWCAKGDARSDVYRARAWAASSLRAVTSHAAARAPALVPLATSEPAAIPTVNVTDLPRERDEVVAPKAAIPTPIAAPAPGAPMLKHAPGPR